MGGTVKRPSRLVGFQIDPSGSAGGVYVLCDFDPNGKIFFIGGEEFFCFYPLEAQNFIGLI